MKIAIDLGHGAPPKDTGAGGYQDEEYLIRAVAPWMANELMRLGYQVKTIDVKVGNSVTESLSARCDAANDWGADLFVSLHFNAFEKDKASGSEVFAISSKAKIVATAVQRAITTLGFKDRGVKDGSHLFVLKYTDMPAILIEPAFCDSKFDMDLLAKITPEKLGKAIANAIHNSAKAL
jgi:N-acetylmuramoyl-L-alanine amidase